MTDLPVACALQAPERQKRREQLLDRVFTRALETRELEDGYAFRFAPDDAALADLMRLIQLERQCCAFLRFRLTFEPGGGPVWLELTGPAGTRAFLADTLGLNSAPS